jgi:hypothetical protein
LNPRSATSRAVVSTHMSVAIPTSTSVSTSMFRSSHSIPVELNALEVFFSITSSPI